jgi:SAM-dependent methyltransferase
MWPTTRELFARVGLEAAVRCLDAGCGGGDVTIALAQMAPTRTVTGIDIDETKVEIDRADATAMGVGNVSFRVANALEAPSESGGYDLVYARARHGSLALRQHRSGGDHRRSDCHRHLAHEPEPLDRLHQHRRDVNLNVRYDPIDTNTIRERVVSPDGTLH